MPYLVNRLHATVATEPTEATGPCPLMDQMPGVSQWHRWHDDRIHYRMQGEGSPILLVHAPDTGGSCLEWRHNMEALSAAGTVYAVDLPGYGLSDARPISYTADLYIRFLTEFLRRVVRNHARVIGSGLGASYLVHVADRSPDLIDRMVLIAPAGLTAYRPRTLGPLAFAVMGLPGVSNALVGSNTSRCAIKEHLERDVYTDDRLVGPLTVDARYWVCQRPNGERAERSRLAGLQNTDIRGALKRIRQPAAVVWGSHATNPPCSDLEMARELNPSLITVTFDKSGVCPHEEEAARFNRTAFSFMGNEASFEGAA